MVGQGLSTNGARQRSAACGISSRENVREALAGRKEKLVYIRAVRFIASSLKRCFRLLFIEAVMRFLQPLFLYGKTN